MPRYFNSYAEAAVASSRPIARERAAAEARALKDQKRNSPEALATARIHRALNQEHFLKHEVARASDKLVNLQTNLNTMRVRAEELAEMSYRTGKIHADTAHVRLQVDGLPSLIERAQAEVGVAEANLTAHQAAMTVEWDNFPKDDAVDGHEVELVGDAPRGRGRPRKSLQ